MIKKQLLKILVCPENRTPLSRADRGLLEKLNRAIGAGQVENRAGQPVEEPIRGGLVREDATLLYPVVDNIPVLLIDEAIALSQIK